MSLASGDRIFVQGISFRWLPSPSSILPRSRTMPKKPKRERSADIRPLEDRVLYSATPLTILDNPADAAAEGWNGDAWGTADLPDHPNLHAPLSDGASVGDGVLGTLPIPVLVVNEDALDSSLELADYFGPADEGDPTGPLTYSLISNSNSELFAEVQLDSETGLIELDFADDAFGDAVLTIQASDGQDIVENDFEINILPVNDRPTTSGFSNVTVDQGADQTIIDLHASFDDVEDADDLLTFEVVDVSNQALFDAITIDHQAGTLTLDYAEDALGQSQIVLRATDSEGLSVEITSAALDFDVSLTAAFRTSAYRPDFAAMGVGEDIPVLSHYAFFDYDPATGYDYSEFSINRLRYALNNDVPADYNGPVAFNIELGHYNDKSNTADGRDNLAEVLDGANSIRPDLDYGYYRLLPEKNWWQPVMYQRGLDEIAAGDLDGWYARNFASSEVSYFNWLARNELYRTEQVSMDLGGGTVADRIDVTFPSLYMPYSESNTRIVDWQIYADHNIREARKFGVDVIPFISPSVSGVGTEFASKDFFRTQLDTMFEHADGAIVWAVVGNDPFTPENGAWVDALEEFMDYIRTPTEFTIAIQPGIAPEAAPISSVVVDPLSSVGTIDLWQAFDDPDHADSQLEFSVVDTQYQQQFSAIEIDPLTGQLNFELRENAGPAGEITIRATDPDGWFAETIIQVAKPTLLPAGQQAIYGFELTEDGALHLDPHQLPGFSHLVEGPNHASAFDIDGQGALSYSPEANWFGTDTLSYQSVSGRTIDVQLNVLGINDAPDAVAHSGFIVTDHDLKLTVDLGLLFVDPDGPADLLSFEFTSTQGSIIDSVFVDHERAAAIINFAGSNLGTAYLDLMATDQAGLAASNTLEIVRASTAASTPSPGDAADLGEPDDTLELLLSTPDLQKLAAGDEEDDEELVMVPLLSAQN